jgi:predicted nuclease with TOPRIM domain
MSDVMLHAVLNMPIDLWDDSPLDKGQRHSRYIEASQRIEQLEKEKIALFEYTGRLEKENAELKKGIKELIEVVDSAYINEEYPDFVLATDIFNCVDNLRSES